MANICINLEPYSGDKIALLEATLIAAKVKLTPDNVEDIVKKTLEDFLGSSLHIKLDTKNVKSIKTLVQHTGEILDSFIAKEERKKLGGNSAIDKARTEKVKGNIKSLQEFKKLLIEQLRTPITDDSVEIEDTPDQTTNKENSEEYKNQQSIENFERTIFKTAFSPKIYRRQLFSLDIVKMCVVNTATGAVTTTNDDLNDNIIDLKNTYYLNIVAFLESIGQDSFDSEMFDEDGELNKGYIKALNAFYKYLIENEETVPERLRLGWRRLVKGEDDLFFKATSSYINLQYFDQLLTNEIGKVININKNYKGYEVSRFLNKYSFNTESISDLAKGWETQENRDAISEWSRFSKVIIGSIPMYNRRDGRRYANNVSMVTFANAFSGLFNSILYNASKGNIDKSGDIMNLLTKFHAQPNTFIKQELLKVLQSLNLKNLIGKNLLSSYDADVLYSVYKFLFEPKTGIEDIETNYIIDNFANSSYSILDSIMGVIDRTMAINYLENKVGPEGETVIAVKSKFPKRQREMNLRGSINAQNITRGFSQRQELYKKYSIKEGPNNSWTFTIGDLEFSVRGLSGHTIFSALIDKVTLSGEIPELNIANRIDTLLGDESAMSTKEVNFKRILEFIQDNLQPIKLLTETGLEKLMIAEMNNSSIVKELTIAAARAAVINKLYLEYAELENPEDNFYKYVSKRYPSLQMTDKNKTLFIRGMGTTDLATTRISDSWVDDWIVAEAAVYGDVSRANTKDTFGNSIGNYSTSFLGGNLSYYSYQSKYQFNPRTRQFELRRGSALANLLTSALPDLVQGVVVNTDSTSRAGVKKLTRNMKAGELIYQAIFHNFFGSSFLSDGILTGAALVQPTTYSDKVKAIQYAINMNSTLSLNIVDLKSKRSYVGKTLYQLSESEILDLYLDTIGKFYKLIQANTISKFETLLGVTGKDAVLNELKRINSDKTILNKEDYLVSLAESKGIDLVLESDYRINKKGEVYLNELLDYYANYLYASKANLLNRLNKEKINFINDIIDSNTIFYTNFTNSDNQAQDSIVKLVIDSIFSDENNAVRLLYKEYPSPKKKYLNDWVKDGRLILAKDSAGNEYIMGDKIPSNAKGVEINPVINQYFMLDSLLSNNLRFSLTGTELAHPTKMATMDISEKPNWKKLEETALKIEGKAQGTQLKRNVIIPATLQYYKLDTLRGVTRTFNMAVAKDLKVPVYNFKGEIQDIDSADGACYTTAAASILENNSLQDQKVGDIKKTILHSPNYLTGGTMLGKWATFALTNELISDSLSTDVNLYEINKRLTDIPWYINRQLNSRFIDPSLVIEFKNKVKVPSAIDLTRVRGVVGMRALNFAKDILQGKALTYRDYTEYGNGRPGEIIYSIKDFGKENDFYYTDVVQANFNMELNSTKKRLYHAYDAEGNHFTFDDVSKIPEGYTTINSNFQLWEALGGLQSVQLEDNKWVLSEASNYATVAFMNLVAFEQSQNRRDLTQHNYYQPLKNAQISYLANTTSIKNSAANVNQADFWKNPNKTPHFTTIQYDGIGVQMDADHEADESLLTEFSQVIVSLAAGGRVHYISRQVYQDLENIALLTSSTELEALESFLSDIKGKLPKNQAISQLYDIVVRTIVNNFKSNNQANLTDEQLDKVRKHLNENISHLQDSYKLPFSDPGVYSSLMPTFASSINSKSVKRKFPGSGYVMHPSFGFKQLYDLRLIDYSTRRLTGEVTPHQFSDIFDMYKGMYKKAPNESYVQYQKRVVKSVLDIQQSLLMAEEQPISSDRFRFLPNTKVIVRITDTTGKIRDIQISLDDPKDYVVFKQNYWKFLVVGKADMEGNIVTLDDLNNGTIQFFTDITRGRDLMPAKITWKDSKGRNWNIFDTLAVRASFTQTAVVTDLNGDEHNILVPKDWNELKILHMLKTMYPAYTYKETLAPVVDNVAIQATFDNLDAGFFINEEGEKEQITDLLTTAAEVILSSMNRSKFPDHTSLPKVLLNKKDFKVPRLPGFLTDADLLLLKQNKQHSAIKFGEVVSDINDINSPQLIKWDNIKPVYSKDASGNIDKNNILIYALTKDSSLQFPIGHAVEKTGYKFTDDNKVVNEKGEAVKGEFLKGNNGEVLEIEYFVKKYTTIHTSPSKKVSKHILYTVNQAAIESANQSTADIISRIFAEEHAMELRLGENPDKELAKILTQMHFDNPYMANLSLEMSNYLNGIIDKKAYDTAINKFYSDLSTAMLTSFLRLREVTASRIPAQTLQSFMLMNTVGYTRTKKNVCYVTPWQTFLQGSDYDIDKAYIMGCEIDKNGLYVAWSPLFDYTNLETLKASEKLPFPSGRTLKLSDSGWDISNYIEQLNEASTLGSVAYLTKLSDFLYDINDKVEGKDYKVTVREDLKESAKKFINQINLHLKHLLSQEVKEAAYRNSVASKINLVVQHVRNMNHAYSPIKIENIRPDNADSKVMSLMNPATKFIMQVLNMVGKGVIGITAVGEKIFFNLTNYWNESLRKRPDKYYNLAFSKTFSRLNGRYKYSKGLGEISKITITKLANVNFDFNGVESFALKVNEINDILETTVQSFPEIAALDRNSLEYLDALQSTAFLDKFHENIRRAHDSEDAIDLYISELLSAATDNAKELVLAQINAGLDLAGNYLYLLTLGFNVKDIMAFMTSPALNTINSLSESNMFIDLFKDLSIDNIVDLLQGDLTTIIGKNNINSKLKDKFGDIHGYIKARIDGTETESLLKLTGISSLASDFMEIVINKIKNNLGKQSYDDYLLDLAEFKLIKDSGAEATRLGTTFLGLNQGLPASEVDLLNKIRNIKTIVDTREKLLGIDKEFIKEINKNLKKAEPTVENLEKLKVFRDKVDLLMSNNPELARLLGREYFANILGFAVTEHERIDGSVSTIAGNFDSREWLMNDKYKNFLVNYYNIIKDTWNIFDAMLEIPHYRALVKLLQLEYVVNHYLSAKSNIIDKVHNELLKQGRFLDDNMLKALISYVDDRIIDSWFNQQDILIPAIEGWNYFTPNATMLIGASSSLISLDTPEGRASFKYIMENYIIPGLLNGTLPEITVEKDGNLNKMVIVKERRYDLADNPFIQGLIQDLTRDGIPYYKLNMDMMNIDATPATQQQFQDYLDGLLELRSISLAGRSLSDWFMIYNLYVNKNNYGQDRLTSIFRSFILTVKGDNILNDYYNYIGTLDYSFNEEDILLRMGINFEDINLAMAKTISERMEAQELSSYVKEYLNGFPIYKRKTGKGLFSLINMFPSRTLSYDAETNYDNSIKANIVKYFLRYLPNQGNIDYYRRLLSSTEESDILEALAVMLSKGLISINIFNC